MASNEIVDIVSYEKNGKIKDIITSSILIKNNNKSRFKKGSFITMSLKLSKELRNAKDLTGENFRLLFFLIENVDYNRRIKTMTQKYIAEQLNINQSNVSKGLSRLKKKGYIYKHNSDYYFNEEYFQYAEDRE